MHSAHCGSEDLKREQCNNCHAFRGAVSHIWSIYVPYVHHFGQSVFISFLQNVRPGLVDGAGVHRSDLSWWTGGAHQTAVILKFTMQGPKINAPPEVIR